jgi:hypothetical protein
MVREGGDAAARRWGQWIAVPVHPVLIAAYPILYLWATNRGEVQEREVIGPLVIAVGVTLLVVAGLVGVGVARARAALIGSLVAAEVLLFGHVTDALAPLRISETRLLLGWLAIGVIAGVLVLRVRRDPRTLTILLNLVSAVLVANSVIAIAADEVAEIARGDQPPAPAQTAMVQTAASRSPATSATGLRDVYLIVVEDYGSPRTLSQYLDVHDDGFFDWLTRSGFTVLPSTTSNYGRTPLSMASLLNMTYLDQVAAAQGPDSASYAPVNAMVDHSAVAAFFKDRGYLIAQLGSQYYLTAHSSVADVNPVFGRTSDFQTVLYQSTILPAIAGRLGFEDAFTERKVNDEAYRWELATFPSLRDLAGPKYVLTHLFLPHHPWIVDDDGDYISAAEDKKRTPAERYDAQWAEVDRQVRAMIEPLLQGPEATHPIIILTTDEGPNPEGMATIDGDLDWSHATDAQLDQKFGIFAAYYLPGVDSSSLNPTMSSVNAFRFVFDRYFDAGLGLLPDKSWIHQDKHHPYVLTDITDRLPGH